MGGFRLRAGTACDLPKLNAIEHDAARAFLAVGYDFCASGPARDARELRRALDDGAVFVAEAAPETSSPEAPAPEAPAPESLGAEAPVREILAFALLWRVDGEAHLLELAVARDRQGRGLGRALVAQAEDWARAEGYAALTLTTYRDVPWNAPLYRRWGFEAFEPEPSRVGLAAIQEEERAAGYAVRPRLTMRKALGPGKPGVGEAGGGIS